MVTKVLIVDDAIFMRNMLRDILTPPDFEVVGEAENGVEAVEKYRQLSPDLVTMDVVMQYKSGIEATREILQLDPNAVIVMCSALGQESLVAEALDNGAMDFVVKPFRADDVRSLLKKVLSRQGNTKRVPTRV
jgi:two-component system chemotaxis response regulator CheY